jgi:hypothetical protein
MIYTLIVLVGFLSYFIYRLRYEFSYFPLFLMARLQGNKFRMAKTLDEIKKTLLLTDKGRGIEELIATPAWLPIISLESVNGSQWIELKRNFLILQKHLPSVQHLGLVTKHEMNKFLAKSQTINEINSKHLAILTLKIFVNWMFNELNTFDDVLSEEQMERVYQSSIEYRKEIAFKGVGCRIKKQESVDIIVGLLKKNEKYKNLFNDWSQPEFYSVIMQPFIISPMINVSDIAVTVKKYINKYKEANFEINAFIDHCIFVAHPFPLLERYDKKTNTQIFINLGDFIQDEKYNYGYGPRACLGRLYAREFLKEFFEPILINNESINYMPEKMHLYSGRDNDNGDLKESLYQLKSLGKILFGLFMERMQSNVKAISTDYD